MVTLKQVRVLSRLLQGPGVLGDLRVPAAVQTGPPRCQLLDGQGLHELAHGVAVTVESADGIRGIFPCAVPKRLLTP